MHLGNRYAQHSFAQVPNVNIARSSFLLNHTAKDTMDFDYLTPFYVREILPGDTFNVNVNVFARLATQKVPIMDNMYMDWHFFFVPNRLVWENWERFNGAQDDPGDSTDYLIPQTVAPASIGFAVGGIADHMGLPTGVPGISVSALPFRAYQLIYNEWYRNQNVASSYVIPKGDGPDNYLTLYSQLAPSAPAHDYFNTALPWPQKGPAVELPLGSAAPVVPVTPAVSPSFTNGAGFDSALASASGNPATLWASGTPGSSGQMAWLDTGLEADLSSATAATINALRQAFMVQSLLELDARGGTRYVEILQAHFNVISPDFRLQRPEFLGGGRSTINAHPVAQTSPTTGSDYAASLSSFATMSSSGGNIGYSKSFVEHGYVIGICRARADITYQQGIRRDWSRKTRYDYFWPKLQLMGEQAILNKELYAQGTADPVADEEVFGYAERYAEYRTVPSEIRGQFRSTFAQSLDVWHLAQEYASLPVINSPFFFNSQTPIERCIANTNAVHLLVDMFFEEKAARPIVSNPTPATLGRF